MSFLTIVLCISTFSAFAQKGTIEGTVIDAGSDEPIPFLNVYLESDNTIGTTTDFNGDYSLSAPAGTQVIIYSSLEYGKIKRTVTVTEGQTVTENVEIKKSEVEVETIVVKTDKYAKPIEDVITSLEVIKPNVLENKGSTDVTSALEQAPGLTIVDGETQLRGGSGYSFGAGSRVMILVDDLPLLSGDAGRPSWSYIPIENIEQIEVTKGASSVLYGSAALNGAINVRTAYPENEPKTRINFISGMWDSPRKKEAKWWQGNSPFYTGVSFMHKRKVNKAFSFVVGGNVYRENGFTGPTPSELYNDSSAFTTQKDLYFTQGGDTVGYLPTGTQIINTDSIDHNEVNPSSYEKRFRINFNTKYKNQKIKGLSYGINGSLQYSKGTSTLLWLNNNDGLYRAFPGAFTTTIQTQFNFDPYIHYFDGKGNKHTLNTRVYYLDNNNDNNQANKNTVAYGEYRYMRMFKKIPDFRVSAGIASTYVYSQSQLFKGLTEGNSASRTSINVGTYLQLEKKFFGKLNLLAGLRWEYFKIEDTKDNKPVFRAGANYKVGRATVFRTSFGQGFRFPTMAERYINTTVGGIPIIPNPDLEAETSWNFELAVKQGFKIGKFLGYVDLAGFVSQFNNYVEFIAAQWNQFNFNNPNLIEASGLGFKSVNTGDARVSGVDFSILGGGDITENFGINVLAGYTYSRPITLTPDNVYGYERGEEGNEDAQLTYNNTSLKKLDDFKDDFTGIAGNDFNLLKYRYEHLIKADIEFNIHDFMLGGSFRFYSYMKNVDEFFYRDILKDFVGLDARSYRESNRGPEYVFDFRIGYTIKEVNKISFIVNNAFNREYALRPLSINAPRSFALQYTLNLTHKEK